MERVVGEITIDATVLVVELVPPQAVRKERQRAVKSAATKEAAENRCMYPPRRRSSSGSIRPE
jgi:hypothetical protein